MNSPICYTQPTEQLATALGIKASSIRTRLCKTGSYFGLKPRKLPNGRLLWPANALEQLTQEAGE